MRLSVASTLKVRTSGCCTFADLGQGSPETGRDVLELEALRVRRCFGLENHITSSRLASGQGREIAKGLVFQEAACARGEIDSWKVETPMGTAVGL